MLRYALIIGLFVSQAPAAVMAQTAVTPQPTAPTRDPNLGDPVAKPSPPSRAHARAAAHARADRQPPGVENGNQPDRAMAGGGAH